MSLRHLMIAALAAGLGMGGPAVATPSHTAAAATAGTPGNTFTNPLFKGADPWVTRVDGMYYFSGSNCGKAALCIKRSRSLSGLASAPWIGVWSPSHKKAPNAKDVWAPELHHVNGRWYIYFAADAGDNDHHRLYVVSADRPQGPYKAADTGAPYGRLKESSNHWAIDPDVFHGADGKLYITWSCTNHADSRFPQRVCLARMSDPTHIASKTAFISTPNQPWETHTKPIQEGPVGYSRDGHTYITYSASASWVPNGYSVGLLSLTPGADPLQPASWHKSGPIFDHHGDIHGPGSVVFVPSPDNTQWWVMYHSVRHMDCKNVWACRDIRMQPMHFDAQGAPVLGVPVNSGVPLRKPSGDTPPSH
ncbi:glycoside hydrolase family 43 protein [Oleiagrimonas sp. C23AA]|uniref:glycoside hydrolase family 43 protein n=1 Tax=Oleiagrimonas sp. C23AA TaxID=2719047 RepID=UPI001422990D|nr:glycoside hydrolase family 43 protein [Oleiagrimonas sp. C23AA]NII12194.1 family 43 glycosylhydrolase [Oleiagrimonas sp. C23AA]